jgi:hypothetical protein
MRLQSEVTATQVLAGMVESFGIQSLVYVGKSDAPQFIRTHFPAVKVFEQTVDQKPEGHERPRDLLFIGGDTDDSQMGGLIDAWQGVIKDGGLIAGEGYHHKAIGVHKALAERFSLLQVTVMPDGVWCYQKPGHA